MSRVRSYTFSSITTPLLSKGIVSPSLGLRLCGDTLKKQMFVQKKKGSSAAKRLDLVDSVYPKITAVIYIYIGNQSTIPSSLATTSSGLPPTATFLSSATAATFKAFYPCHPALNHRSFPPFFTLAQQLDLEKPTGSEEIRTPHYGCTTHWLKICLFKKRWLPNYSLSSTCLVSFPNIFLPARNWLFNGHLHDT